MTRSRGAGRSGRTLTSEPATLTHEMVASQLSDFLAGDLTVAATAAIEAHLANCPACTTALAALQRTIALLRTLPPLPAPASLRQRLLAVVRDDGAAAASGRTQPIVSPAPCPPHYWLIEARTHRQQTWICYRCGQTQTHEIPRHLTRPQPGATS